MADGPLLVLALACAISGMAWFALGLKAHWRQVRGGEAPSAGAVYTLRAFGAAGLAGSLWLCLRADAPSMAALVWVMWLALAALLVAFTLAWRPALLAPWSWVVALPSAGAIGGLVGNRRRT